MKGVENVATDLLTHHVESIGKCAGLVWQYLRDMNGNEAVTLSKLAREVDAPRDLVMQGVGWLAREDKVTFEEGPRSKLISLT